MPFHSQAPTRVDLAGGTLDIWPLYLFHNNSQTVNVAIQCYARCRLTPRRDGAIHLISRDLRREERFPSLEALLKAPKFRLPLLARLVMAFAKSRPLSPAERDGIGMTGKSAGFVLESDSDSPSGAGLGGSSALNIAICGALARFNGTRLPLEKLIEIAGNVEAQVLGVPTGEQDYYAAAYGGVQAIRLTAHGVQPARLVLDRDELAARGVLCYTGESRNSGINNWEVMKAHIDGKRAVLRHFDRIAAIAAEMGAALEQRDWSRTARLLRQEWEARKKSYPGITTARIERLVALARRNGARAARVCGAGGGGCVFFLCEPDAKGKIEAALRTEGARVMPFAVAERGLTVRTVEP
jgi:D-glycero-alpha-D-manno-heptose-7-phosphate kinase